MCIRDRANIKYSFCFEVKIISKSISSKRCLGRQSESRDTVNVAGAYTIGLSTGTLTKTENYTIARKKKRWWRFKNERSIGLIVELDD